MERKKFKQNMGIEPQVSDNKVKESEMPVTEENFKMEMPDMTPTQMPQMQTPQAQMPETYQMPQTEQMPQMYPNPQAPMTCCPYLMNMQCPMIQGQGVMPAEAMMPNQMMMPYDPMMAYPYMMNQQMYEPSRGMMY